MKDNKSVERVLSILELISNNKNGITLGDIYRKLNIPKSTAYDILQALYKADAIYYKDEYLKTYVIGSKMFAIGSVYIENSSLITISKPYLETFSDKYNLTSFISKKAGDKIISIYKYTPQKAKIQTLPEGSEVLKLHSTAIGKAFLSFDNIPFPNSLEKYTDYTITSLPVLKEEIERIKNNGYAFEDRETEEHIRAVALPVYNFENRVVGIISFYGLYTEFEDSNSLINELKLMLKEISQKLGYRK